jgi:hypothetical protein
MIAENDQSKMLNDLFKKEDLIPTMSIDHLKNDA